MKNSITELFVEHYYKLQNYIVMRNILFLPSDITKKHNWSDLDILAVSDEVHLISCKDFLPSSKDVDKIINNLAEAKIHITKNFSYLKNKSFKKFYIYGGTDKKTLAELEKNDIVTINNKDLFIKYLKLLDDYLIKLNKGKKYPIKSGQRYYCLGELEGLDKIIEFLLNNNLLNDKEINDRLQSMKYYVLSIPK